MRSSARSGMIRRNESSSWCTRRPGEEKKRNESKKREEKRRKKKGRAGKGEKERRRNERKDGSGYDGGKERRDRERGSQAFPLAFGLIVMKKEGGGRGQPRAPEKESPGWARVSSRTSASKKDPLLRPYYIVYLSSGLHPFLSRSFSFLPFPCCEGDRERESAV